MHFYWLDTVRRSRKINLALLRELNIKTDLHDLSGKLYLCSIFAFIILKSDRPVLVSVNATSIFGMSYKINTAMNKNLKKEV